jgi:hypothetical protein
MFAVQAAESLPAVQAAESLPLAFSPSAFSPSAFLPHLPERLEQSVLAT